MYWDINDILPYNALFNFILGERSNGKTYGVKKHAIKRFLKSGEQFIYLRRSENEVKEDKVKKFFDDVELDEEFKSVIFNYKSGEFFINGMLAGYTYYLRSTQDLKSVPFPKVRTIIYDEFLIEQSTKRYIKNEPQALLDFMHTVDRRRGLIKIYLIANAISITNPYFLAWDVEVPRNKKMISCKNNVLIQITQTHKGRDPKDYTPLEKFIEGTKYGDYALNADFLLDNDNFVKPLRDTKRDRYFITIKINKIFYGIYYAEDSSILYVTTHYDKKCTLIYVIIKDDAEPNIALLKGITNASLFKTFKKYYINSLVQYDSVNTKNIVDNSLKKMMY